MERPREVKIANSSSLSVEEIIPKAVFSYEGFKDLEDLQVLDTKGMFQVIFGQPFLRKFNPDIDWVARTITINRQHRKPEGLQTRTLNALGSETITPDLLNAIVSSSYDAWAYLAHNDRCTCCTDLDQDMDACTVCTPTAYPAATPVDTTIPVAEPLDHFDETGEFMLSAKQFAKAMKQEIRSAPKNTAHMAYLVLLTPEGHFDFSMVHPQQNADAPSEQTRDPSEKSIFQP